MSGLDELHEDAVSRIDAAGRALSAMVEMDGIEQVVCFVRPIDEMEAWKMTAWQCAACETVHVSVLPDPEPLQWDRARAEERMLGKLRGDD